jgi:hypothetical protein
LCQIHNLMSKKKKTDRIFAEEFFRFLKRIPANYSTTNRLLLSLTIKDTQKRNFGNQSLGATQVLKRSSTKRSRVNIFAHREERLC